MEFENATIGTPLQPIIKLSDKSGNQPERLV